MGLTFRQGIRRLLCIFAHFLIGLVVVELGSAKEIPLRDPRPNEQRPSWWLSCWAGHIVVVEGKIQFDTEDQPDVTINIASAAHGRSLPKQDVKMPSYQIATVTVRKLLFASPGIDFLNTRIAAVRDGRLTSLHVLVPRLEQKRGNGFFFGLKPGAENEGILIFSYNNVMPASPLVFDEMIPADEITNATAVFEFRSKHNYHERLLPRESAPPVKSNGIVGLGFDDQDGFRVAHVLPDSPAARAGIRVGDYITAVENRDTSQKSVVEITQLISGPPGSTVELTIKEARTGATKTVRLERIVAP